MKINVPRETLVAAAAQLSRIVERRNTIPILSNLLLRADEDGLAITATDLDMEATCRIKAEVLVPGAITLPAGQLKDIAAKVAGESVSIDATAGERQQAIIKSGRSRFQLNTLPEADFPSLAAGEMPAPWTLPAKDLLATIQQVQFAISSEETRYYLNGIHFHVVDHQDAPHLTAVATDGHRLALRRVPAPEGAADMPPIILPRKAVVEFAKLLPDWSASDAKVAVSTTKLRLEVGTTTLITKLIDGTFPDYTRVIPAPGSTQVGVNRKALAEACDRVCTVSTGKARAVKFAFAAEGLTLKVTDTDMGEATDDVATEHEGEPIEIGFNGTYLQDIAGASKAEKLNISLSEPGLPALITGDGESAALFVLMPMRV
ncbi:DNA polymerase III subunit beta [Azorhizobium oxalatiphilum]|uniref:Beta sliding clamp n=1 Tax=Azorhizobium oxalatiphilum TaxID=980631 RepID=A0A917BUK0_9HYPH|nr:DNA polymerase III subunit beta [Azorhizobium oxalatiphilum]GGF56428.1 DNA polymerase III subunit beta [Azorhizobium oxalatiphilum]